MEGNDVMLEKYQMQILLYSLALNVLLILILSSISTHFFLLLLRLLLRQL